MRSFTLWVFFGLLAVGIAACGGGGSTTVPTAKPVATTASNVIVLPTPPATGGTAAITLPGPTGLVPTLTLGPGFTAGTQLFVSTTNYGQTQSTDRSTQSTIAACPVVIDVTMYFSNAVPLTALQAFAVQFSALPFLGSGTFNASFYDGNATQTSGSPLAPTATNGCATAPNPLLVIATSAGTVANGTATFANFTANTGLSSGVATKFGLGANNAGAIPANEVVGFYVSFTASTATATPTATASGSPSAQPSATASASLASLTAAGGSFTLPTLNSGAYSGSVPYATVSPAASNTGQYTVMFGNYLFAASPAPTQPPGSGNVYAAVNITNGGSASPSFTGTASTITMTVPTIASKTSVTVRMWEMNGQAGGDPICLGNNVTTLAVTPAAGGVLTFLTPFQGSTATTGSNCTDNQVNPFPPADAVFILVTDT